jgi:hypothetical protein
VPQDLRLPVGVAIACIENDHRIRTIMTTESYSLMIPCYYSIFQAAAAAAATQAPPPLFRHSGNQLGICVDSDAAAAHGHSDKFV